MSSSTASRHFKTFQDISRHLKTSQGTGVILSWIPTRKEKLKLIFHEHGSFSSTVARCLSVQVDSFSRHRLDRSLELSTSCCRSPYSDPGMKEWSNLIRKVNELNLDTKHKNIFREKSWYQLKTRQFSWKRNSSAEMSDYFFFSFTLIIFSSFPELVHSVISRIRGMQCPCFIRICNILSNFLISFVILICANRRSNWSLDERQGTQVSVAAHLTY